MPDSLLDLLVHIDFRGLEPVAGLHRSRGLNDWDSGDFDFRLRLLRSFHGLLSINQLNDNPSSLDRDLLVLDWIKDLVFLILLEKLKTFYLFYFRLHESRCFIKSFAYKIFAHRSHHYLTFCEIWLIDALQS